MIKALGADAEKGNIHGFFFACTALRLYDGTFILQSRPVLINQNADANSRYSYPDIQRYTSGGELIEQSGSFKNNYLTPNVLTYPSVKYYLDGESTAIDLEWGSFDPYEGQTLTNDTINKSVEFSKIKKDINDRGTYKTLTTGFVHIDNSLIKKLRYDINSPDLWGGLDFIPKSKNSNTFLLTPIAITSLGKFQYKVEKGLNKEVLSDIVESVCVFITQPVSMYDTEDWSQSKITEVDGATYKRAKQIEFKPKTNAEIIDDLINSPNFYLVKEDKLNSIKEGDWVDIDLKKDAILKNLVQQEALNLDSNVRNSYSPKTSFSYTGRLHIAT